MARSALAMCSSPLLLLPAYGAKYSNAAEIRSAWENGKDFRMYGQGRYCSIRNIEALMDSCSTLTITDPRSNATYCVPF